MKIRVRLKEVLKEQGMSQKELAKKTGLRESTISDICRNSRTVINFEHLARIAEVLKIVDIAELIEIRK